MSTASKRYLGYSALALVFSFSGCSQSNNTTTPPPTNPQVTVSLNQSSVNIAVGATTQFAATVKGSSNTSVAWSVDGVAGGDSTVGTITASGLYTAPSQPGAHTVMAASVAETSSTAKASVTVVNGTAISPSSATLDGSSGQMQQFTASVTASSNTAANWSVDNIPGGNSSVGTISAAGLYTPPGSAGTHTVTASSAADPSSTASATVTVFTFSLSPQSSVITASAMQQFTANIDGLSNTTVSWSVDGVVGGNATTGTITAGGSYTAPSSPGSHTIMASSAADTSATATAGVTVTGGVTSNVAVLTYHNDDARDGANLQEVTLTPANVNSTTFGKLLAYPVDGQAYAQPLYMSQVKISGGTHDVVFVETQNNSVYAFDADATSTQNAQTFWHVNLGPSVYKGDLYGVNPDVGILSTPVIDASTNTMYLVVETSNTGPNGTPFFLHALDVATGADKFGGPVAINGSVPGTGDESVNGTVSLGTDCYQRMGLALNPVTNAIEIPFGSCAHGWVLAYDKTSLEQKAIFNDTPDWQGGGFWASDGAPAIDDTTGDVYLMSGVDSGDQNQNSLLMLYNDSFLQLDPTNLTVKSYFTPDDNYNLAVADADLGSGSNILLPSPSAVSMTLGGGKDGNVFVLNRNDMGGFNAGSNNVIQTVQICTDGDDNIFSTPVYWNGFVYYHCNDNVISAYAWNANSTTAPLSTTPSSSGTQTYQSHGATPSLSANGAMNGIIWDIDNSAYSTVPNGPSVLHAYNATDLSTELYNSSQAASGRDTAGQALKFTVPTIANGKVFVSTSAELDIYGLLP